MKINSTILLLIILVINVPSTILGQHPAIFLYDKDAEEINPMTGDNINSPFSTVMTCGSCHDYDEITSGYHFQMGWDVVDDNFGVAEGRPWEISNGMLGKWCPMYLRQMAKKENESADAIDLTIYEFIKSAKSSGSSISCGACHPGGGGLEYDREGNRYDEYLAENPELRDELDGDYYKSNWDKSGVVEADCFICHLEGYNFDERAFQLTQGNFKWAVVVGTRIGFVEGSVNSGQEPTIVYNKRFFNEDGSITLDISWPPPDDNCMFCHGQSDVRKRGFSWNDMFNPDVHNSQGISCVACHPAGPDHMFAKGNASDLRVADHLDGTMKNCKECHTEGLLGATVPEHKTIRPSHLEKISCEACHIPSLKRAAAMGFEATTGKQIFYNNPLDAKDFGELKEWKPVYERWDGEVIYPFNSLLTIWWGNLESDSLIYPLFLKEHKEGWKLFSDKIEDDNDDGEPEVNREDEIIAGLIGYTESLADNQRFSQVHPVFVKGGKIYHLGSSRELLVLDREVEPCTNYSISHNVAPVHKALGANGCYDCHASDVYFFKGQRVLDMYNESGDQTTKSIGRYYGCNPLSFAINTFHQQILSPIVSIGIILVLFLITFHYHSYGPKHIRFVPDSGEVLRFTIVERGVHLFRLISFIILSITGLIMAFNATEWQILLFSSPKQMLLIHIWAGVVFIITTIIGIKLWIKDAIFASYDIQWVRHIGGYLGYKGKVASDRFNAGQKMFYWYTTIFGILISISGVILTFKEFFPISWICITSTFHNLIGFIMLAGVLSHAYLGTIANPGTWRVLVDGYVTKLWAIHHHPIWFEKLIQRGIVTKDKEKDKGEDEVNKKTEDDTDS